MLPVVIFVNVASMVSRLTAHFLFDAVALG